MGISNKMVRSVEDIESEVKEGTETFELNSHKKSRGGFPSPRYYPQAPFPTLPLLSSSILLAQHAQKRHTKDQAQEGGNVN